MEGHGNHKVASGSKVVGHRPGNRGPCTRCGFEIEYRNDRPRRMCATCLKVDPKWGLR